MDCANISFAVPTKTKNLMRMKIRLLVRAMLFPAICFAAYKPQEMWVIPWGDSAYQLKIDEPGYEDVNYTPEDSSDDRIEKAGPSSGLIDKAENIYLISYYFMQLKGFNREGRLIFDYSEGEVAYNPEFYRGWLSKIYVDSLSRIYILGGADEDYVAVTDTSGHLIDKLSPLGVNSGIPVANIYPGSNDAITFYLHGNSNYGYTGGQFHYGGSLAWLAKDGDYYYANFENDSIRFIRYRDPDIHGISTNLNEKIIFIKEQEINSLRFLGLDNLMNIYIFLEGVEPNNRIVQVYDTSYKLMT